MDLKKAAQIAGIVGAIAAVFGLVVVLARSTDGSISSGDDSNIAGGDIVEGGGDTFCNNLGAKAVCGVPLNEETSDDEIERRLTELNDSSPTGDGPWPFIVLHDEDKGLWIRTGPELDDERVDVALGRTYLYAECQVHNDFDADPATGVGGLWYKVHWPEVSSPAAFYAYAGYLVPVGHDGSIPQC